MRWRTKGRLVHIQMNSSTYLYPKQDVERLIREMNSTVFTRE
jgi:predicted site-specific integrase-resolvase